MNREVYKHVLATYGRTFGWWFGLVAEFIRSVLMRIILVLIMSQLAANLAAGNIENAKLFTVYFFVTWIAGAVIGLVGELMATWYEDIVYRDLSITFYRKLTSKDMTFYRNNQSGYLVSLFRQYLDGLMDLVRLLRLDIVHIVVSLVFPALVLFYMDWRLGSVALGIVVVQLVYVTWSSSVANKYRKMSHEIYRKVTGEVADEVTNIVAFKSGGVEDQAHTKLIKLAEKETATFWKRRKTIKLLDLPRDIITAISMTAGFFIIISSSSGSPESVGLVVLTLMYMFQIVRNVGELSNLITKHDDLITKVFPTLAYLADNHEEIKDPAKPKKLQLSKGAIEIKHVDFSYPGHGDNNERVEVFEDLNIAIKGGERVGIVGLSGAGKSTLASLLMRFDEVTGGSITIDGIDIRDVRQTELHRKIAYVPQEPILFHRSIRENIAYFNKADEHDIIRAAKAAHAHEFIETLPGGYDTVVGERGVKLSGGQKQRVVIARAILKNTPIMIFDEATSALDSESEQIIQKALPEIIGQHTAVVIAHRLGTIAGMDRILVMHKGKVVEEGTHGELLALKGRYNSLWQKQTNGAG